jgi:hypothetical protein
LPGSEGQNLACFLSGGKYTPNTNVEIFWKTGYAKGRVKK